MRSASSRICVFSLPRYRIHRALSTDNRDVARLNFRAAIDHKFARAETVSQCPPSPGEHRALPPPVFGRGQLAPSQDETA